MRSYLFLAAVLVTGANGLSCLTNGFQGKADESGPFDCAKTQQSGVAAENTVCMYVRPQSPPDSVRRRMPLVNVDAGFRCIHSLQKNKIARL